MIKSVIGTILILFPVFACADTNYKNVFIVDSHRIGGVLVRYVKLLSDPCLTIQALHRNPDWSVLSSKSFCSFEGVSLKGDIFDSSFDDIYFADDGVHFTLSFTLKPLTGEQLRACVVPVKEGVVGDPVCSVLTQI